MLSPADIDLRHLSKGIIRQKDHYDPQASIFKAKKNIRNISIQKTCTNESQLTNSSPSLDTSADKYKILDYHV